MEAGRDIRMQAAAASSAGNIAMKAGRDITMETAAVKKTRPSLGTGITTAMTAPPGI